MPRLTTLALLVALGGASCSTPRYAAAPLSNSASPCWACGAPGAARWPDGRVACDPCLEDPVVDDADADLVLREAATRLQTATGLEVDPTGIPVRLVSQADLSARAGDGLSGPDLQAFLEVQERLAEGQVVARRFQIYTLYGAPRPHLVGVLAHELVHVWHVEHGEAHGPVAQPLREGVACWAQALVWDAMAAHDSAAALRENPDPVYGGGCRRFEQLVRAIGRDRALAWARTRMGFPRGY